MANGYLPLSPSIMKEFEIFMPEVFHTTNARGLDTVIKLQGKKVDIPTFTRGSEGLAQGARTFTDFVIELEGYSSFSADTDMVTLLDRNGHRWLSKHADAGVGFDGIIFKSFTVPIMKKLRIKYNFDVEERYYMIKEKMEEALENMNGKEKKEFIKFYYDESKKLITKSLVQKLKKSLVKARANRSSDFTNDEVLLHNFKIKGVYRVVDSWELDDSSKDNEEVMKLRKMKEKNDKELKNKGVKVLDWIDRDDIKNMKVGASNQMPY